jgi:hypothetical protein
MVISFLYIKNLKKDIFVKRRVMVIGIEQRVRRRPPLSYLILRILLVLFGRLHISINNSS